MISNSEISMPYLKKIIYICGLAFVLSLTGPINGPVSGAFSFSLSPSGIDVSEMPQTYRRSDDLNGRTPVSYSLLQSAII